MTPSSSAAFAIAVTLGALWLLRRRSGVLLQATFAVTFGFLWMIINTVYIDSSGGVFASELGRVIGGGNSATILALFYALFVAALLLVFSPARVEGLKRLWALSSPDDRRVLGVDLYALASVVLVAIVVGALVELLRGTVPALTGLDRATFAMFQAGPVVKLLYRYEMYICLMAGVLHVEHVRGGGNARQSVGAWCMAALVVVYVLLGHKFSGVFFNLLLFLVPTSLRHLEGARRPLMAYAGRAFVGLVLVGIFSYTVYSYVSTTFANPAAVSSYLEQRLLIQQGELWWGAHERVVAFGDWDPQAAFSGVISAPIIERSLTTGNTSLTYLMYRELGMHAHSVISQGYLFTGASPTILLELFGLMGGFAAMLLGSLAYGWLLYLLLRSVLLRDLIAVIFVVFVYGIVHNVMIGGHVTEFTSRNFYVKVIVMALVVIAGAERRRLRAATRPSGETLGSPGPVVV